MTSLANWVERGIPPDGTNAGNTPVDSGAANATTGVVARTRPLCPYPKIARYGGSGDINEAGNFVCAAP
jgi:hypothetical protein